MAKQDSTREVHRQTTERELVVSIWPRFAAQWEATGAELVDEGLIPTDFEWPQGKSMTTWVADGFFCMVHRTRPPGVKGPMSVWTNGDWWSLRRYPEKERGRGLCNAERVYEARLEYEDALFRQSPAWEKQYRMACVARADKSFAAFMSQFEKKRSSGL